MQSCKCPCLLRGRRSWPSLVFFSGAAVRVFLYHAGFLFFGFGSSLLLLFRHACCLQVALLLAGVALNACGNFAVLCWVAVIGTTEAYPLELKGSDWAVTGFVLLFPLAAFVLPFLPADKVGFLTGPPVFIRSFEELEFVRIGICQNWNLSEWEFVRIGICLNRNLSELEFDRISNYLIWGRKCNVKLTWCFSLS